jgi:hypothetical protein
VVTRTRSTTVARFLLASLVAAAMTVGVVDAQRPDPRPDARVPGVRLKTGWRLLFHDGCRFAVPGSWRSDADGALVSAPDGSNISVRMIRITSWSAHKAQIRAAFGRVNILHDDSDHRLWFEIGDRPRVQHYIDVADGLNACAGLLELHTSTTRDAEETATGIADSIGPAPDRPPLDFSRIPTIERYVERIAAHLR